MSTTSVRTRPSPVLGLVLGAMVVLLAGVALVTPGAAQGEPAPTTLPFPSATTVAPPPTTGSRPRCPRRRSPIRLRRRFLRRAASRPRCGTSCWSVTRS